MSITHLRLARLCRRERQIIHAMRLISESRGACDMLAPDGEAALSRLVQQARDLGYLIQKSHAEFVSQDERTLIGWLALCQRDCCDMAEAATSGLHDTLRAAAEALRPSHLLPYQTVFKADFGLTQRDELHAGAGNGTTFSQDLAQPTLHRSIRARAVAFAREHGRVSTRQLNEIGVTSPYLKALRKRGALIRVKHGFYEVPAHQGLPASGRTRTHRFGLASLQRGYPPATA